MAIRYVNKGTWLKALFYTAPYLSVIFRARFFWDTRYSGVGGSREVGVLGKLKALLELPINLRSYKGF